MNGIPKYSLFVKVARGVFQFGVLNCRLNLPLNETIITGQKKIATSHNLTPIFSGNLAWRNMIPFGQIVTLANKGLVGGIPSENTVPSILGDWYCWVGGQTRWVSPMTTVVAVFVFFCFSCWLEGTLV